MKTTLAIFAIAGAALQAGIGTVRGEEADLSAAKVMAAWSARQSSVVSARFVWSAQRTLQPGAMLPLPLDGGKPWPTEVEVVHQSGCRFDFDGDCFAYHYYPQNPKGSEEAQSLNLIAFDGSSTLSYGPPTKSHRGQAHYDFRPFSEFNNLNLWPFLINFRPMGKDGIGVDPESVTLKDKRVAIDGQNCAVLEWKDERRRRLFFVIPQTPFLVIRYREFNFVEGAPNKESLSTQFDLSYGDAKDRIRVPKEWTATWYRDGKVRIEVKGKLTEHSFNEPLPEDAFDPLVFPEGTLIIDDRIKMKFWQRANGKLEPIKSDD